MSEIKGEFVCFEDYLNIKTQLEIAAKALEFYAESINWQSSDPWSGTSMEWDTGEIAIKALSQITTELL
jgi:hypothetical protein